MGYWKKERIFFLFLEIQKTKMMNLPNFFLYSKKNGMFFFHFLFSAMRMRFFFVCCFFFQKKKAADKKKGGSHHTTLWTWTGCKRKSKKQSEFFQKKEIEEIFFHQLFFICSVFIISTIFSIFQIKMERKVLKFQNFFHFIVKKKGELSNKIRTRFLAARV